MKTANCYDWYFMEYAMEFFGVTTRWEWFKAQALAESGLDPVAKSPVGAFGVMQLMPGTSREVAELLGIEHRPDIPHVNIRMGVAYMRRCWDVWKKEDRIERMRFAFGSYNAGVGNIVLAQRMARVNGLPVDKWESIVRMLPKVTGDNATETIGYVARIERYYSQITKESTT